LSLDVQAWQKIEVLADNSRIVRGTIKLWPTEYNPVHSNRFMTEHDVVMI